MSTVFRLIASIIACLSLSVTLATAQPSQKGTLVIGVTQFPSTFHPIIDAMLAKSYILGMAIRPVTIYGHDWKVMCVLCADLPTLENGGAVREKTPDGKDGVALTYKLKPGLVWADGTPVTTDDIRFAWEVGKHPESGVSGAEVYQRIWQVDTPDPQTIVMHTDRVTYNYSSFQVQPLPAHLDRAVFEAAPRAYRTATKFDTDTTNPGLYFGPYRISRVSAGAFVELVRNEHWQGPQPHFDKIVVKVISNTAALEANLLSGSVDYIAGELGLTLDQALALEKRRGNEFDFVYKAGLIYEHIDVNLDNPILADRRVRQALLLAADRQAISTRLFGGKQPVAHGNVSPLDWIHSTAAPTYGFDPERAAELLEEAGWKTGDNGIRINADGEPLRLTLMTTAGSRVREQVQQVLQHYWKQVGIDLRIQNEPARVFFGQTVRERKFKDLAMFACLSAPESVPRTTLHSGMIPTAEKNWSGQNFTGYSNPVMDELIDAIEVDLDRASREKRWHKLQDIYATDLPALPLYFRASPFVLPKWLKGVRPTGHQITSTLWVEEWQVEP